MHRSLLTALVAVPCIALAIVAVRPAGGAGNAMADSTSVAVMNPSQILEGLAERAEAEAELRARFDELKTEADARTSEIRSLQAQAEQTQDAAARQALIEEIEAKSVRAIAFDQFAARQFDIELALLQQDLYQRIKAATAELAQANGIDIEYQPRKRNKRLIRFTVTTVTPSPDRDASDDGDCHSELPFEVTA